MKIDPTAKLSNEVVQQYREHDPILVASMHLNAAINVLYNIDEDLTDELIYLYSRSWKAPAPSNEELSKQLSFPRVQELHRALREKLSNENG